MDVGNDSPVICHGYIVCRPVSDTNLGIMETFDRCYLSIDDVTATGRASSLTCPVLIMRSIQLEHPQILCGHAMQEM
jgi:hypothetical protein